MKILIAPDKFKGSLTAMQVCEAISAGVQKANPNHQTTLHPMADGGDGSVEIIGRHLDLKRVAVNVENPLGKTIKSSYFVDERERIAYIELAAASGLVLLTEAERNPLLTSTWGAGRLINHAIEFGASKINLFLGGSATNDAGMGILSALGFRFLDHNEKRLAPSGQNLLRITKIDGSNLMFSPANTSFTCFCDVNNPLYGENGAAYVYAGQKGASPSEIKQLDDGLRQFASVVKSHTRVDLQKIKGGGAAGGIAAGMAGLVNAKIESGLDKLIQITNLEKAIQNADFVITGEGSLDDQSLNGKVAAGVLKLAKKHNKPTAIFVGQSQLGKTQLNQLGDPPIYSIMDRAKSTEDAIQNAAPYLSQLAEQFCIDQG